MEFQQVIIIIIIILTIIITLIIILAKIMILMSSVHCIIMISNKITSTLLRNKSHEWISQGGWEVNILTTITIQHQNLLVSLMYFWTASKITELISKDNILLP